MTGCHAPAFSSSCCWRSRRGPVRRLSSRRAGRSSRARSVPPPSRRPKSGGTPCPGCWWRSPRPRAGGPSRRCPGCSRGLGPSMPMAARIISTARMPRSPGSSRRRRVGSRRSTSAACRSTCNRTPDAFSRHRPGVRPGRQRRLCRPLPRPIGCMPTPAATGSTRSAITTRARRIWRRITGLRVSAIAQGQDAAAGLGLAALCAGDPAGDVADSRCRGVACAADQHPSPAVAECGARMERLPSGERSRRLHAFSSAFASRCFAAR